MESPLRVLTHSMSLNPVGGIEMSTLQDSVALAGHGHSIELMFGQDGAFRSDYERAGIALDGPFSFDFELRRPLRSLVRFAPPVRSARTFRPDLLWLNRFEQIAWAETLAMTSRMPIVCHLHHLLNPRGVGLFSRCVAHFVAVSEFMRDSWVESGIQPSRITVVRNAVPSATYPYGGLAERSAMRSMLDIRDDVPVVLYYGRIVPKKGVGVLLDAWREVESRFSDALLLVVGSSSSEESEFVDQLKAICPTSTRWYSAQADMIPLLHCADIVVFPTLMQESFGRVIIEGMATGRPVISSRIGATPEILFGPMSRFLVEPGSSSDLGDRIASLLRWREEEPELATACTEWVESTFPFEDHVIALEQIFKTYSRQRR